MILTNIVIPTDITINPEEDISVMFILDPK